MNDVSVDPRRLELLLALSRLGSMRAVSDELGVTTSTVSQQIATLAREAGTPLLEHEGRAVRLTPAGERLAEHAVHVLAAIEAARAALDPLAEPSGTVRVAAFATAVRDALVPVVATLAGQHPAVRLQILEHEPDEAFALLARDGVDLALAYDYDLAPATYDSTWLSRPMGTTPWGLGVPTSLGRGRGTALDRFAAVADRDWIVNSRNSADEEVVRTIASLAGFTPAVVHRADSLELCQHLVQAGLGVALLPLHQPVVAGVRVWPLREPGVTLRAHAVVRRGRQSWPPLTLVLNLLDGVTLA